MQLQERELITGLFDRLKPFENQPRDGEAETLIRTLAAEQPAASYLLVQTVLVQEQALKAAQERIAELEARPAAGAPAAGFLASAPKVGPWGGAQAGAPAGGPRASVPASVPSSVPATGPSTRSPLQAAVAPQAAGGGFLRTAMATAAGVAGGALLFEGIRNLVGGNPGPFGGQQQAAAPQMPTPPEAPPQQQAFADEPAPAEEYDTASLDDGGAMGDDSWA